MYVVTVEFVVKPDFADRFADAVQQQAADSLQREVACRRFDVCFADDDPARIFLYEMYDDKTAFQQALSYKSFIPESNTGTQFRINHLHRKS